MTQYPLQSSTNNGNCYKYENASNFSDFVRNNDKER